MRFQKGGKETSINVLPIKGFTRDVTGAFVLRACGRQRSKAAAGTAARACCTTHTQHAAHCPTPAHDTTAEDDGKFVPIAAFECRGIEPTAFHAEVCVFL